MGAGAGDLLTLYLPVSPDLDDGSRTPIAFDPLASYLIDTEGNWVILELRDGELEIDI